MSVIVNEKGVFSRKISISRHGSQQSDITLDSIFIKNTDKYSMNATKFICNVVPPLWRGSKTVFKIRQKYNQNAPLVEEYAVGDEPQKRFGDLVLENITSIPQLLSEMVSFFQRWDLFMKHNDQPGVGTPINDFDVAESYRNDGSEPMLYCGIGCDTGGRVALTMNYLMLQEFFLVIDSDIAKLIGFDEIIWCATTLNHAIYPDGTVITNQTPDESLYADLGAGNVFLHAQNIAGPPETLVTFNSAKSIFNVDMRLSIDVDVTIPHANIITAFDKKETHEYTLLRLDVANYIKTTGTNVISEGVIRSVIQFDDQLQVGPTDFVRQAGQVQAITLKPGHIQAVNTSIWVRYFEAGKIVRYPLDVDETGFWHVTLLFTKKTT